jgi:nucleoside-diphosphate-sugar epimerase
MSRERVLITGGSGFLGACLVRDQVARRREVHLLLRPDSRAARLIDLEESVTVHRADLLDAAAVARSIRLARPEVVYHLAAYGFSPGQRRRADVLMTNLIGTSNLIDVVADTDIRLVQTGSSWEYGACAQPHFEDSLLQPRGDYAVARAATTLLCQSEAAQGRPIVTVRVFSVYGPAEDPHRLIPYVMGCCRRGETARILHASERRDFIHSDDVVELLDCAAHHSNAPGQVLHAATGKGTSVREAVETILAVCGRGRGHAVFDTASVRSDDLTSNLGDITRTTAVTGWRPRYDFRGGIERLWAWCNRTAIGRVA